MHDITDDGVEKMLMNIHSNLISLEYTDCPVTTAATAKRLAEQYSNVHIYWSMWILLIVRTCV